MEFYSRFSRTRGGWAFGVSAIFVGENIPILFNSEKLVLKTMLMPEKDIGYNLITNDRQSGVLFKATIEDYFKDLRPSCRNDTLDGVEMFYCTFLLRKCSQVVEKFKDNLQLRLPERNVKL